MYNVQCLAGHVYNAPKGSELEKRCIERKEAGFLDALLLSANECRECIADRRNQLEREVRLCAEVGCPGDEEGCKDGCLALQELNQLLAPNAT